MPYFIDSQNCVRKDSETGPLLKCYDDRAAAEDYLKALYANVKDSALVDFSMSIIKASYEKSDNNPRRWRAVDSDTEADIYQEKMSLELYKDFVDRINNNTPVPEQFKSIICEDTWCGGMPYLSIAHFKAGESARNVPGKVDSIYIDGNRLKSKGTLDDSDLGRKVFDSLCDDLYRKKSGDHDHLPVRISIGFLDLQHKHLATNGGQEYTFTRTGLGQICPMCEQGIGGKIYLKGQLVHLALTRVPVNPRTEMIAEKSMDEIKTKKDDARSIIAELADQLDEKSLAEGTLVVRAEGNETGSMPVPDEPLMPCYDPNTDTFDQNCLNRVLVANMVELRKQMTPVKSNTDVAADANKQLSSEKSGVEATMEEKATLGGVSVPEKKFNYEGIDGDPGNNITAAPIPVKAKDEEAGEEDDSKDEEKKEMSALDKSYQQMKSLLAKGATIEEVQNAFNAFGNVVEQSYAPKQEPVDMNNLAEIIKSAVEGAVAPLRMEIATLKQNGTVSKSETPKSRALRLTPADLMQKSTATQPVRQLSQIEKLARRTTYAGSGLPVPPEAQ